MANKPSIATLTAVFADRAKDARAILDMSRAELLATPAGETRARECYHPPTTGDIRMHVLDALDAGTYGVEAFELTRGRYRGEWLEYLNVGDPYVATIIRIAGRYRVAGWGDYAERYTRAED